MHLVTKCDFFGISCSQSLLCYNIYTCKRALKHKIVLKTWKQWSFFIFHMFVNARCW